MEGAVIDRIGVLASDPQAIALLTEKANALLSKGKPEVEKRVRSTKRLLHAVNGEADRVVRGLGRATVETAVLLNEQLAALASRRQELETAVRETERELADFDRGCVTPAEVRAGLDDFGRVFAHLRPFEQKQLIHLLLRRAELGDRELVLEIYRGTCARFAATKQANDGARFAEPLDWLPDEDSNLEHRG